MSYLNFCACISLSCISIISKLFSRRGFTLELFSISLFVYDSYKLVLKRFIVVFIGLRFK